MSQLFICFARKGAAPYVLEADIAGCFDAINHEWLVRNVHMDKVVLRKWLRAGVVHKGQLMATTAGNTAGWDYQSHLGKRGIERARIRTGKASRCKAGEDESQEAEGKYDQVCGRFRDYGRLFGVPRK